MSLRRVVITGRGLRTPLGHKPTDLFDALLEGRTGVRRMPDWADIEELHTQVGAPVPDFDPKREIPRKFRRTMGRVAMFAAVSARQAVDEAGLDEALLTGGRTGVAVGSTVGSGAAEEVYWQHYLTRRSTRGIRSTLFFQIMSHTCATNVALYLGVTGNVMSTNAACASATQGIGEAYERIRRGHADVMIAGGADELHPTAAITFDIVGGSSRRHNDSPEHTPRPFDSEREGIVVGEGAGIVVLEALESARARGATIYGEVLGYGSSCDARHMSAPASEGLATCLRLGLESAGLEPEAIDYVNAHATGTPIGDAAEAEAVHSLFGDAVPVSSIKGHLGHTLGACGGIEVIACLEAMRRGVIPPTRNLVTPDVAPIWLPTKPMERPLRRVLTTNFAFGGINTCLILGPCTD